MAVSTWVSRIEKKYDLGDSLRFTGLVRESLADTPAPAPRAPSLTHPGPAARGRLSPGALPTALLPAVACCGRPAKPTVVVRGRRGRGAEGGSSGCSRANWATPGHGPPAGGGQHIPHGQLGLWFRLHRCPSVGAEVLVSAPAVSSDSTDDNMRWLATAWVPKHSSIPITYRR